MKITSQYLYELLPAYYRLLDGNNKNGQPLKAFMAVLAEQAGIVEQNIDQLYENWFIETCEEWVVPYIGELLGVRGIHEIGGSPVFSRRAYVANTLGYRRRKGTVPILEQLAQDTTGWRASAVEFFQLLCSTQNLNHLRLHSMATVDLKDMGAVDLIDTAFEKANHIVEVGGIKKGIGQYNIQNVGIYLWRLNSYRLIAINALKMIESTTVPAGAYMFSVLGINTHLFNNPDTEQNITSLAQERNVPGLLRRRGLHDELKNIQSDNGYTPVFFEDRRPVLRIYKDNVPIDFKNIAICNLNDWKVPADPYEVAIDPVLGRFIFKDPPDDNEISVDYSYGFSADLGGGPYDRLDSLNELNNKKIDWHVGVAKAITPVSGETIFTTIQEAILAWNDLGNDEAVQVGLIAIMDSKSYEENLTGLNQIKIAEGKQLYIIAAQWDDVTLNNIPQRPKGTFNPESIRPHLKGDITIEGIASEESKNGGLIVINGLLIEGNLTVLEGNLNQCKLTHCTLVPPVEISNPNTGNVTVEKQDQIFELDLNRCITGKIELESEASVLLLKDSIVDQKENKAIQAEKSSLCIEESTIWGNVSGRQLEASNTIFNDDVDITRTQYGCVRFSFITPNAHSPKRYRCQPELAIVQQQENIDRILDRIQPTYNSTTYGHHAYGQLASSTPVEISKGASNESEIGCFNHLQQPQRMANLHTALEEYLRLGMEAGILLVT